MSIEPETFENVVSLAPTLSFQRGSCGGVCSAEAIIAGSEAGTALPDSEERNAQL